eukprot:scaffold70126_cov67-Phaeocystis_antarctica.AAC.3
MRDRHRGRYSAVSCCVIGALCSRGRVGRANRLEGASCCLSPSDWGGSLAGQGLRCVQRNAWALLAGEASCRYGRSWKPEALAQCGRLRRSGGRLWLPLRPLDVHARRKGWQLHRGRLRHEPTVELVLVDLLGARVERPLDVHAVRLAHVPEGLHLGLALTLGRHRRLDVAGPLEPEHLLMQTDAGETAARGGGGLPPDARRGGRGAGGAHPRLLVHPDNSRQHAQRRLDDVVDADVKVLQVRLRGAHLLLLALALLAALLRHG